MIGLERKLTGNVRLAEKNAACVCIQNDRAAWWKDDRAGASGTKPNRSIAAGDRVDHDESFAHHGCVVVVVDDMTTCPATERPQDSRSDGRDGEVPPCCPV